MNRKKSAELPNVPELETEINGKTRNGARKRLWKGFCILLGLAAAAAVVYGAIKLPVFRWILVGALVLMVLGLLLVKKFSDAK